VASLEYFTIEELLQKKAILGMQDGNHGEQHPRQSDFVNKGTPFLTASHLFDNQVFLNLAPRISPDKAKKLRIGWIQPNDVLLSHNATVGRVGVVPHFEDKAVIGTSLTYYRLNPKWFSPDFFALVLSSQEFQSQLEQVMKQTTRNQVPITRQRELIVPVLPISEQKRIAAIAQKADRLRRTRRYALQLSDTYLRSVFLEMFGDPATNPKGWKLLPFGEVVKNQDSRRKPIKESERAKRPGIYPYYGAIGIIDYIDDFLFDETTLLVEEDGMNLVTRAKPIAFLAHGKYWVNNHAHIVSSNGTVNLNYLCGLLNIRDIGDFVTGIDQMKLTQENLDRIPIPVPPLLLQEKFAQIVHKFERLRTQQREADRQAEHLFQTLLHRAFRGELTPQHSNDEPASVLLEQIGAEQTQAEAEAKAATQAMSDAAEYLGTKAKQQDTEPIQLTIPGIE
jgi:type I restriction enzyme S subunit